MIIAVDGPTASGKGTIAKALAAHFCLPHLDTGLLYRAVGKQVELNGGDAENEVDALTACAFPDKLLTDEEHSEVKPSAAWLAVFPSIRRFVKPYSSASKTSHFKQAVPFWTDAISGPLSLPKPKLSCS